VRGHAYMLSMSRFFLRKKTMLLSISCYKHACHYFLHLWSTLCTRTCHILFILLLCSAAQKMKSSMMKTSSRHTGPGHLPVVWYFVLLHRPLVISFVIRLDVINTGYTVYFNIYRFMCEN
jgi:hypothetical protein